MKMICLLALCFMTMSFSELAPALKEKALSENKNIAVYFAGSDWCSNCNKFKRELLDVPQIDSLLKNNFVYYMADFPQRIKLEKEVVATNEFLAEKLNPGGEFPVLVLTDENWSVKAKIYRGNSEKSVVEKLIQFKK